MQGVTLLISIIGSALVIVLRPAYGLAVCLGILIWYPDYLRISIGTIDISAARIVLPVLLLRCLADSRIYRRFAWSRLDTWVAISMVVYVGMYCLLRPLGMAVENRGGFLMDTWLAYMCARLIITDQAALTRVIKIVAILLALLAVLTVIESATDRYFFIALARFRPWDVAVGSPMLGRWGLSRAIGPFSHSIMLGMCFAMFLPLIWTLRHERGDWHVLAYPLSIMAVLGAFSSMSSNPWMMVICVIGLLAMERYRRWVKLALAMLVVLFLMLEVVSNRHFYHVLFQYMNPVGGDWWQRAKLIDCAIETIGEWWLTGYRGMDPDWGSKMGMTITDVNNEFILAGVEYGIWGVIVLCIVLGLAFQQLCKVYRLSKDPVARSWIWALGVALAGLIVSLQGVSLFGQNVTLFYCLLGFIGASSNLVESLGESRIWTPDRAILSLAEDVRPVVPDAHAAG
jgi:hypothetical protein